MQIISLEEERQHGLAHGAFSYLVKPVTTEELEAALRPHQDASSRRTPSGCSSSRTTRSSATSIVELLGHDDIEITAVGTGAEALEALLERPFDCCVLDLRLPDMSGFELLEQDAGRAGAARRARSSSSPARS